MAIHFKHPGMTVVAHKKLSQGHSRRGPSLLFSISLGCHSRIDYYLKLSKGPYACFREYGSLSETTNHLDNVPFSLITHKTLRNL